jgi:excisionase family DNA binding protein
MGRETLSETARPASAERWLMPAEAAALFPASTRALRKWAKAGVLSTHRTPGGHRRYRESEVLALVDDLAEVAA